MKRILFLLNLTDEEGRINFIHAIVVGCAVNLFLSRGMESSALLLGSFVLLAWQWKVSPPKGRRATVEEIDSYRDQAKEALDQIKKLNLKLGFRG